MAFCVVSYVDASGIRHTVEQEADGLYEWQRFENMIVIWARLLKLKWRSGSQSSIVSS
jgi:hypothetical protein